MRATPCDVSSLTELAKQFKAAKVFKCSYHPDDALRDLSVEVKATRTEGFGLSFKRLVLDIIRAGIFGVLGFTALLLFQDATTRDRVAVALIVALVAFLSNLSQNVVYLSQSEVTTRIDSPEQFEEKFCELMDHLKPDRWVIVIDNLDRFSPERVLEILGTVKTFLEPSQAKRQPIFIVPCDEKAIRSHLESSAAKLQVGDADEFLRKFFNATLRINQLLEEDIRSHIRHELRDLVLGEELSDEQTNDLVMIITAAFRSNPRRVKQFLNTLTAKLLLVREREAQKIIVPTISSEVAFLARLTVIEEEFPAFYLALQTDVRVFARISEMAMGFALSEGNIPALDERLLKFMRATRLVTSSNIHAFIRLRLTSQERKLPELQPFREALMDADLEGVERILTEASDSQRSGYASAALQTLRMELENGYLKTAVNVVDAFTHVGTLRDSVEAGSVVETLYTNPQLREGLSSLEPEPTLQLLTGMNSSLAANNLIDSYLELFAGQSGDQSLAWKVKTAEALVVVREQLSDAQCNRVREIARALAGVPEVQEALGATLEGAQAFLSATAFEPGLSRLILDDLQLDGSGAHLRPNNHLQFIRNCQSVATPEVRIHLIPRINQLLAEVVEDSSRIGLEPLLVLLGELRDLIGGTQQEAADQFIYLIGLLNNSIPSYRRNLAESTLSALWNALSPEGQNQAEALVRNSAMTDPPEHVSHFIQDEVKYRSDPFPSPLLQTALTILKERFANSMDEATNVGIAGIFVYHLATIGPEQLADLFQKANEARNPTALKNALAVHRAEIERLALQPVLGGVVEQLIEAIPAYPIGERVTVVAVLGQLKDHISDDDQRMCLRDHILTLMQSEDITERTTGADMLDRAEETELLREGDHAHIAEQLCSWLFARSPALNNYALLLDRMTRDARLLSQGALDNALTIFRGLLLQPPPLGLQAAGYLERLGLHGQHLTDAVSEIIHVARQQGDPAHKHSLIQIAARIARKDRRQKAALKVLDGYMNELNTGSEADQQLAQELSET